MRLPMSTRGRRIFFFFFFLECEFVSLQNAKENECVAFVQSQETICFQTSKLVSRSNTGCVIQSTGRKYFGDCLVVFRVFFFFFSRLEFVRFQNAIPQHVSQYPSSKFFKRRISLQDAVRCCRRRPVAVARMVVEVGPALFSPVANPLS